VKAEANFILGLRALPAGYSSQAEWLLRRNCTAGLLTIASKEGVGRNVRKDMTE
jgi:hypothetical protein